MNPALIIQQNVENLKKWVEEEPEHSGTWLYSPRDYIRQPGNFVGLNNLGATCYINSIIQQFFMMPWFRKDFYEARPVKEDDSNKILDELQLMFAFLQDSNKNVYDPSSFALAYTDANGELIDPHVQMDVDEFFNFLFDRLEHILSKSTHEQIFKKHFGGILAQKVKSKECKHLSEREESFFAIQCEVKNINSLEDSLREYVKAETLDDENKYFCEQCDRKVDALKRMCIKRLPNHLIVTLKRFDFDFEKMKRLKINDFFSFPDTINMKQYTDEYLSKETPSGIMEVDLTGEEEPFIYKLGGVLVHSGTADSGHYYSFIRDRQTQDDKWFHFNDSNVSEYDSTKIPADCFGGDGDHQLQKKHYSAYILVYDRIWKQPQEHLMGIRVPEHLKLQVDFDNERFQWEHYIFNPTMQNLLYEYVLLSSIGNPGEMPSVNWERRRNAIELQIIYFFKVFIRSKDLGSLPFMSNLIQGYVKEDSELALWLCELYSNTVFPLQDLILECPFDVIREAVCNIFFSSLWCISHNKQLSQQATHIIRSGVAKRLGDMLIGIKKYWKQFNEFWNVLMYLCQFSPEMKLQLMNEASLLESCVEIFQSAAEFEREMRQQRISPEAGPKYDGLLALLVNLLDNVDWESSIDAPDAAMVSDGNYRISGKDYDLLFEKNQHGIFCCLDKIFFQLTELDSAQSLLDKFLNIDWILDPEKEDFFAHVILTAIRSSVTSGEVAMLICRKAYKDLKTQLVPETLKWLSLVVARGILHQDTEVEVVEDGLKFINLICQNSTLVSDYFIHQFSNWAPRLLQSQTEAVREAAKNLIVTLSTRMFLHK